MHKVLLEVCCGSADDVIEAYKAGANRVELNSNLFQGGLTSTLGTLQVAKSHTNLPIVTMIRPRGGGFCYTDIEYETMKTDGKLLLEHGSDGLVFGFLHQDGTVNEERTREFVDLCGEKDCVFHRALDVTPDWKRALETLIKLGVKRVLTSGQAADAFFALETISEMVRFAGNEIQILPGGGISLENVQRVVEITGCNQVHVARHKAMPDLSTTNNRSIYFGGALYPPEDRYDLADGRYLAAVRERLG